MDFLLPLVFIIGYLCIILEQWFKVDKAASALVLGCIMWLIWGFSGIDPVLFHHQIYEHLAEAAAILFFLVGAMAIVELIEINGGFEGVKSLIRTKNPKKLLWLIGFFAFFLSAVLDNLTTTIVLITLIRKLIKDTQSKWFFAGIIVLAANSGGAFSPIGDVTTTMLWIGGQVSTTGIIQVLFFPALVSLLIPLLWLSYRMDTSSFEAKEDHVEHNFKHGNLFLITGLTALTAVPIFKTVFHLPPFLGILLGLGVLWFMTDRLHIDEQQKKFHGLHAALARVDISSILFFLGILLGIGVLQEAGHLTLVAQSLNQWIPNEVILNTLIGLLSAVVDNVPLVAATMKMYSLEIYPMDHSFWDLLAYCAGTGGSLLIIGSAAGVMAMGMEKISFFWYLRKITPLALLGYLAGIGAFVIQGFI